MKSIWNNFRFHVKISSVKTGIRCILILNRIFWRLILWFADMVRYLDGVLIRIETKLYYLETGGLTATLMSGRNPKGYPGMKKT